MNKSLAGKVAVVTGASGGIGRAICLALALNGARVIVGYGKNNDEADQTLECVSRINDLEHGLLSFDVRSSLAVKDVFESITKRLGGVDILVNCAGVTRDGLLIKMKEEAWDDVIDTNLKSAFLCTQAVVRGMMKKRWGRIINIGSVIGAIGNAGQTNYAAAKAGLEGLTKSTAKELASRGITVNCISPGYIKTDMTAGLSPEVQEKILSHTPLGRIGSPRDVARLASFLASKGGGFITGQVIHVDGGMFMG